MLYDPKWEKQTKADPFSWQSLISWLEAQNPREKYDYDCIDGGCLLGLYMQSHGFKMNYKNYCKFSDNFFPIHAHEPHTMGAALSRARARAVS